MCMVLAVIVMTGAMFIRETAHSSTRASIQWVTLKQGAQYLDTIGGWIRTIRITWKPDGSPFYTHYRSVYVAVTPDEMTQPTEWTEIQECRHWARIDFFPEERCTVTYPTVTTSSTFWIRVTTNAPEGYPACTDGVTATPDTEFCGDTKTLTLTVTP